MDLELDEIYSDLGSAEDDEDDGGRLEEGDAGTDFAMQQQQRVSCNGAHLYIARGRDSHLLLNI